VTDLSRDLALIAQVLARRRAIVRDVVELTSDGELVVVATIHRGWFVPVSRPRNTEEGDTP